MNCTANNSVDRMKSWIKKLSWEENDERTDSVLDIHINPFVGNNAILEETSMFFNSINKTDIRMLIESICIEHADNFTIDAFRFTMDGDIYDTVIDIHADIHLAK